MAVTQFTATTPRKPARRENIGEVLRTSGGDVSCGVLKVFLENLTEEARVPGACVTLLAGEQSICMTAGVCEVGQDMPVAGKSRFAISCLGRIVTALVVLKLAEEGKFALSDPIGKFLPELDDARTPRANIICVAHLLSQTSGYLGWSWDAKINNWDDLVANFVKTPQLFYPGRVFSEQNLDYVLLGEIVRRVAGREIAELAQEKVFGPLQIDAAIGAEGDEQDAYDICGHVRGADKQVSGIKFDPVKSLWAPAISNYRISIPDLARLCREITYDLSGGPALRHFSLPLLAQLRNPVIHIPSGITIRSNPDWIISSYGMGCARFRGGCEGVISNGMGQCSAMFYHPSTKVAVAIGLNIQSGPLRTLLQDYICRLLSGEVVEEKPLMKIQRVQGVAFRDVLHGFSPKDVAGRYIGSPRKVVFIEAGPSRLQILYGPERKVIIGGLQNDRVFAEAPAPTSLAFFPYMRGEAALMLGLHAFRKVP